MLEELRLGPDGTISSVTLSLPAKFIGRLDHELRGRSKIPAAMVGGHMTQIGHVVPGDQHSYQNRRLLVEGRDLANIYFERHFQNKTDDEGRLRSALRRLGGLDESVQDRTSRGTQKPASNNQPE